MIAIGSDHAGFSMKEELRAFLKQKGIETDDKGTFSEESTDYPDFAHAVSKDVEDKRSRLGILICGSGNGVAMAANKHRDVRCALCWNKELAELARAHNDANILAIPSRFISLKTAKEMVEAFLNEKFEGGRHARRVEKIAII
ncbi:MAG TPA: ribose 5-phosphate isomerase B [Cryomorphaceae bacterium]|nr:ribose 5-phosphate isomerase B [Cryomorphaceae bacterium]